MPWIDYREVFTELEERGRAEGKIEGKIEGKVEGKIEGKAERDMEIAQNAFGKVKRGGNIATISSMLKDLGIPDDIILSVRKQTEADLARFPKERTAPER